jgi:hypothetical protein
MEEILKEMLEELRLISQKIEKLTFVTAELKKPCKQDFKSLKNIINTLPADARTNPMLAPVLSVLDQISEIGEKDAD